MTTKTEEPRRYRFEPYGPFNLPTEGSAFVPDALLPNFWTQIEQENRGLSVAIGCYIFGIREENSVLPWYVGKTEKKSFRFEATHLAKLQHYNEALRERPAGIPVLYLLPRINDSGRFRRRWSGGSSSVARLEQMLIASAISRNPHLLNKQMTLHLTRTVVPGYMNEPKGPRSPSAQQLAALLGTSKRDFADPVPEE